MDHSKTELTRPPVDSRPCSAVDTLECALVFTGTNHFAELGSSVKHPGVFANFRERFWDGLNPCFFLVPMILRLDRQILKLGKVLHGV